MKRIAHRESGIGRFRGLPLFLLLSIAFVAVADSSNATRAYIPGGRFASVLPPAPDVKEVTVAPFRLDRTPVTNAEFAAFVRKHPEWRRDRVARIFADDGYLRHWSSASEPAAAIQQQPVTYVSWFAASAYCEAQGARLPRWYEWEMAAAASPTQADARRDPQWRQQILDWYSTSARGALPRAGVQPENFYGVRDLHGVVWEWIEDHASMLASNDSREQGDPNLSKFCGTGALNLEQKENYAMLMRVAMLSSMKASYSSSTMGFRCAADAGAAP